MLGGAKLTEQELVLIERRAKGGIIYEEQVLALVAEVRRLRQALEQIQDVNVAGWDDGGSLAGRCQSIATQALQ